MARDPKTGQDRVVIKEDEEVSPPAQPIPAKRPQDDGEVDDGIGDGTEN